MRPASRLLLSLGLSLAPAGVGLAQHRDPEILAEAARAPAPPGVTGRRAVRATALNGPPPVIDGRLGDAVWGAADTAAAFIQYQPHPGAPASARTVVRVLYGAGALYIAARLHDARPDSIIAQLADRDDQVLSDWFYVYIDSYRDRRSAYAFAMNPAGVKWDALLSRDTDVDQNWDAVWDGAALVDARGWTVEMRIPLSQLRFTVGPTGSGEQQWGLNFRRWIARWDEVSDWAPVPRNAGRFVSAFGELQGLRDFAPPRRLEVQPYSVARLTRAPGDLDDPFYRRDDWQGSVGADVKYRVAPNVTLTATLNPDFGQVEADRSVVRSGGDYEPFFPEKRPFFLEGSHIFAFDAREALVVHSRNIGESPRPPTPPAGGFAEAPGSARILGAAKLTGQTSRRWSFAVMNAVTAPVEVRVVDAAGVRQSLPVAPLTNFAVARVTKDAGLGATSVGGILTAVNRRLDHPALDTLPSAAYAAGLDARHRFGEHYEVRGMTLASRVEGSQAAMRRVQGRLEHYMQRPDAPHLHYDTARTSLTGVSGGLSLVGFVDRWNWEVGTHARSPEFELNDLGFLPDADVASQFVFARYDHYTPGRRFRRWMLDINQSSRWTFGRERLSHFFGVDARFELPTYRGVYAGLNRQVAALHTRMLGGGPALRVPGQTGAYVGFWTDSRRPVRADITASAARDDEAGGGWLSLSSSAYVRPSTRVELALTPVFAAYRIPWQAVGAGWVAGQPVYVVGRLDLTNASLTARLSYAFSPTLSVRFYTQPFLSALSYGDYKEVGDPHARRFADRFRAYTPPQLAYDESTRMYAVDRSGDGQPDLWFGKPDFRFAEMRSQLVLTWEYRRGSTLFVVWRQDRSDFGTDASFDPDRDLGRLLGLASGVPIATTNELVVKLSYWIGR